MGLLKSSDTFNCKVVVLFAGFLVGLLILISNFANAGVDSLRGRWDVSVTTDQGGTGNVIFFINDLAMDTETGEYFANGCMESSGGLAPLSLKALQTNEYDYEISCLSTVIPTDGRPPYVIQFFGPVQTYGQGVADDIAGGEESLVRAANFEGTWDAEHHDRQRKGCPPAEIPPLNFSADVRSRHDIQNDGSTVIKTLLEGRTDIVSTGMLVEQPDGTSVIVPPFTDIFSPNVDFVNEFRYFTDFNQAKDGDPITGQPYKFTLLDALGIPIPGTSRTDIWTACLIDPPENLLLEVSEGNIYDLSWDAVTTQPGFDPTNGVGFYQISVEDFPPAGDSLYGANLIQSTFHRIPWDSFTPPAPGYPDGFDLGISLSQLVDGMYQIRADSYSYPPPGSGGQNLECETVDFREIIFFIKTGNEIEPYQNE